MTKNKFVNDIENKFNRSSGFTLVEMAIVIVLIGILVAAFIQIYRVYNATERIEVTRDRMEMIKLAIGEFYEVNGRMPCPARMDLPKTDPNFGIETNCSIATPTGVTATTGRVDPVAGAQPIRIGALPIKTIMQSLNNVVVTEGKFYPKVGIDDTFDRWHGLLRYAVSTNMAISPDMYAMNDGAIQIIDTNGNNVTNPASTAVYAIISHGQDKSGAVLANGVVGRPCPAATVPDSENCDNDGVLRRSLLVSTNVANSLDDLLVFSGKRQIAQPIVSSFKTFIMDCIPGNVLSQPLYSAGNNALGQKCTSVSFIHDTANITIPGTPPAVLQGLQITPAEQPSDGVLVYSVNYTPATSGRLIIRAIVPLRYVGYNDVWMVGTPSWNNAIMGAIYLDNTLVQTNELMNPGNFTSTKWSEGGVGTLLGVADPVQAGRTYAIEIYIYDSPGVGGISQLNQAIGWAGSIKMNDHIVDGMLEVMEAGR